MLAHQAQAYVLLQAYRHDFSDSLSSRLAVVDTASGALSETLILDGLHGCGGLALAPDDVLPDGWQPPLLGVSCAGKFAGKLEPDTAFAGVALVARKHGSLREVARVMAATLDARPFGFSLDFVPGEAWRVIVVALGNDAGTPIPDRLLAVDVSRQTARTLLSSSEHPFSLGEVRCLHNTLDRPTHPACGACYVADAGRHLIHRFEVDSGRLIPAGKLRIIDGVGLPPRGLGRF
jgi:hypothetical protein